MSALCYFRDLKESTISHFVLLPKKKLYKKLSKLRKKWWSVEACSMVQRAGMSYHYHHQYI